MIGKKILSYKIIGLIGEGGMGNVYLAEHIASGEKVAIKALLPQLIKHQNIRDRFKNEANTMRLLRHPNIVTFFEYTEDDDGAYIIMEYVEGTDLSKYIKNESGPLPNEQVLKLMDQIIGAFSYAHKNGVLHRDIKPSNILLTRTGQIKVIDFGIAKMTSEADKKLTKTGIQMGAVFYMSPEQVKGLDPDNRTDIYSLGVTLFQMVSGQSPYREDSTEYTIYHKILHEPLPSVKEIYPSAHSQFDAVITKATQKNPSDRYDNCHDFGVALKAIDFTVDSEKDNGSKKAEEEKKKKTDDGEGNKRKKKSRRTAIIIGAGVLLLGLIGWQGMLHAEYKSSLSKAQVAFENQDYLTAKNFFTEAIEKKGKLFITPSEDTVHGSIRECNFEIVRKQGDEQLRADLFSASTDPAYKFTAYDSYNSANNYKNGDEYVANHITLCLIIKNALESAKSGNSIQAVDYYREAARYAYTINEVGPVADHLQRAIKVLSIPFAEVLDASFTNDKRNGVEGILITCRARTQFLKGEPCNVTVWFYDAAGTALVDHNGVYKTSDGKVSSHGDFTPLKDDDISTAVIFIPHAEVESGYGSFYFLAGVVHNNQEITKTNKKVAFNYNPPSE
ncbi:MAG: serine/threonine-protein kinase [Chitinophagaceae bacterium]